jgi:DNA-binding response OmpR family regulator
MHRDLSEQHTKGEVLIVEDTPASLKLLSDLLTEAGYYVRQAPNGELALWTAQSRPPELILLDIRMPGIDGFEVCRRLKATPELSQVPVIFLSAQHDTDDKVRGFELGAVDFIAKPFQAEEILARTDAHVKLGRAQKALAEERALLEQRVAERTAELAREVEQRRANEEFLRLQPGVRGHAGRHRGDRPRRPHRRHQSCLHADFRLYGAGGAGAERGLLHAGDMDAAPSPPWCSRWSKPATGRARSWRAARMATPFPAC